MIRQTNKFKIEIKRPFAETLKESIDAILQSSPSDDDDKLLFSALAEVKDRLYLKLGKFQPAYSISFTPTQALALRILYLDYVNNPTSYLGNGLHQVALEVDQQFR
jgi:hypothetical protein